jgi:hypothetical protein
MMGIGCITDHALESFPYFLPKRFNRALVSNCQYSSKFQYINNSWIVNGSIGSGSADIGSVGLWELWFDNDNCG